MKIEKPCHENFSKMPSRGEGRHCSSCDHIVIDFTLMTADEIKEYFNNRTGKTCGLFMNAQLDGASDQSRSIVERRNKLLKTVRFKPLRVFVIAYFLIVMLLTGCRRRTGGAPVQTLGHLHPRYTHTLEQDPDKPDPQTDTTSQK